MRIRQKAILLVSIPLALQLALSLFLIFTLVSFEREIQNLLTTQEIILKLNKLHHSLQRSNALAQIYTSFENRDLSKEYKRSIKEVNKEFESLKSYSAKTNLFNEYIPKLQREIDRTLLGQSGLRTHIRESIASRATSKELNDIITKFAPINEYISILEKQQKDRTTIALLSFSIGNLIIYIVIVFAVIQLLLMYMFSRVLIKRIEVVSQQISDFEKWQNHYVEPREEDEIAKLTKDINASSIRYLNLLQIKRQTLEIVSHDVRTPLNSLGGLFELVQTDKYGKIEEKDSNLLENASFRCIQLTDLICDLLDSEKLNSKILQPSIEDYDYYEIVEELQLSLKRKGLSIDKINIEEAEAVIGCDLDLTARAIALLTAFFLKFDINISITAAEQVISLKIPENEALEEQIERSIEWRLANSLLNAQRCCLKQINDNLLQLDFTGYNDSETDTEESNSSEKQIKGPSKNVAISLVWKILFASMIPVIISSFSYIRIGNLLDQASKEIQTYYTHCAAMNKVSQFKTDIGVIFTLGLNYQFSYDSKELIEYQRSVKKIEKEFKSLILQLKEKSTSKNNVDRNKAINQFELVTKQLLKQAKSFQSYDSREVKLDKSKEFLYMWTKKSGGIYENLFDAIKGKQQAEKLTSELKQSIIYCIGTTLFIALAGTLLGLWILLESFLRRLQQVNKNSHRLFSREPLLITVKGNDELALLDSQIRITEEEIREREKESKELFQFIKTVLKNPLNDIGDAIAHIGTSKTLSNEGIERIKSTGSEINRLNSLIDDLLDADDLSNSNVELDLDIYRSSSLIEAATTSVKGMADSRNISFSIKGYSLDLYCDKDRTIQVLVNLLGNALHYSPDSSDIKVKTETSGNMGRIEIIDMGPGISSENRQKIFDRFHQIPGTKMGSGLGLFIVKNFIELQNGDCGVESIEGYGTTFWIELPLADN